MITIDLVDEIFDQPEKPARRTRPDAAFADKPAFELDYHLALDHHQELLQAAHQSRLARSGRLKGLAIEVQRFFQNKKAGLLTLAERYARRAAANR